MEVSAAKSDALGENIGRNLVQWFRIETEDDGHYYVPRDSATRSIMYDTLTLQCGKRYRIKHKLPVRLPFELQDSEGEAVLLDVIELTGTFLDPLWFKDVEGIACDPGIPDLKAPFAAPKSYFRFYVGDVLEYA